MDLHEFSDTVAAISTPPGQSGIGIVRLTGPQAIPIADSLFMPASPGKRAAFLPSFTTAYGRICCDGEVVDEVILTVMRAPRTYTTQDVVEINCHGGIIPLRRTLELVLARGARLADPGEFTKRAFVFGRIDLAQAESVLDIISARTEEAQRAAMRQLEGGLSSKIHELRESLLNLLASLEAAIDYGDEGLDLPSTAEVVAGCRELSAGLDELIAGAQLGRALREGLRVAIAGRPNVGKSSLMNALLRDERVIVTPIPGTTRDVVEDTVNIRGIPVILWDTAGLRATDDPVESLGVARTERAVAQADLVLLVLDGSVALTPEDRELARELRGRGMILVLNKSDLPPGFAPDEVQDWGAQAVVATCALTGEGIAELEQAIGNHVWGGTQPQADSVLVTNLRHRLALERARQAVWDAQAAAERGLSEEYVASDLREALDALGEIIGLTTTQEVIDRVFANFCVGK